MIAFLPDAQPRARAFQKFPDSESAIPQAQDPRVHSRKLHAFNSLCSLAVIIDGGQPRLPGRQHGVVPCRSPDKSIRGTMATGRVAAIRGRDDDPALQENISSFRAERKASLKPVFEVLLMGHFPSGFPRLLCKTDASGSLVLRQEVLCSPPPSRRSGACPELGTAMDHEINSRITFIRLYALITYVSINLKSTAFAA